MNLSYPKKNTKRRPKSTKTDRKNANINNNKKESMLAIEEAKKLYSKLHVNPNTLLISQIKNEVLKLILNCYESKDLNILSLILSKHKYFKTIEISRNDPKKLEGKNKANKKKEQYIYQNLKEQKRKE